MGRVLHHHPTPDERKPLLTFTIYSTELRQQLSDQPTFTGIINHHIRRFQATGSQLVFNSLMSGTAVLQTDDQCTAYLAAYGDMHRLKLNSALDQLFAVQPGLVGVAEVIDWGCGQGLASGVLLDYVRHHQIALTLNRFTLIDPSELALSRAADHLGLLTHVPVRRLAQKADSVFTTTLATNPGIPKIHLFSNLLDMTSVDLGAIARTIRKTQRGLNVFVCVSPTINPVRDARLSALAAYFPTARVLSKRSQSLTGQVFGIRAMQPQFRTICRNEVLFSVQL